MAYCYPTIVPNFVRLSGETCPKTWHSHGMLGPRKGSRSVRIGNHHLGGPRQTLVDVVLHALSPGSDGAGFVISDLGLSRPPLVSVVPHALNPGGDRP